MWLQTCDSFCVFLRRPHFWSGEVEQADFHGCRSDASGQPHSGSELPWYTKITHTYTHTNFGFWHNWLAESGSSTCIDECCEVDFLVQTPQITVWLEIQSATSLHHHLHNCEWLLDFSKHVCQDLAQSIQNGLDIALWVSSKSIICLWSYVTRGIYFIVV